MTLTLLLSLLFLPAPPARGAPGLPPPAALRKLFCPLNAKLLATALDHDYKEHGGLKDLSEGILDFEGQFGKCLGFEARGTGSYLLLYKEAEVELELIFTEGDLIRSAFIGIPRLRNDSAEKIQADAKKLPYRLAFLAMKEEGGDLAALLPDQALSISRANQIFLLRAVIDGIGEKKLGLGELVALDPARALRGFSLLQDWKPGTLLSIDTLLNFTVSEKDLSASDLLLSRVEPARFSSYGKSLSPFLSFHDFARLAGVEKVPARGEQPALLKKLGASKGAEEPRFDRPELRDRLGWFASARELCASALAVREELLARNLRLNREWQAIQPKKISRYAIVQARDPGVSQSTVVFQLAGGGWRCVALTANHGEEIEESHFAPLLSRLTHLGLQ